MSVGCKIIYYIENGSLWGGGGWGRGRKGEEAYSIGEVEDREGGGRGGGGG